MNRYSAKLTRLTHRHPHGFTLLEVLVGLMLMALLVVSSLTALSRYRSILALASRQRQAIQVADDLLARWLDSSTGLPGADSGRIPQHPTMGWNTRVVSQRMVCGVPTEIIRLNVWEQTGNQTEPRVLSSIEFVRSVTFTGANL
ncbi:hypothetical protein CA13_40380 [Planctomycetes bacterium CA13]|uniref:Uncharacterized protein n=1 Tax=Novipirellula herctigrandis TaxID=2527986 RepID=A0A5C5Z5V7_9BACT|nr:hypothetical protein CA13_40380 [Planctomycetes bacterium CA13]